MRKWFIALLAALAIYGQLPQAEAQYLPAWQGPSVEEIFTAPETVREKAGADVFTGLYGRKVTGPEYRMMSYAMEAAVREAKLKDRVAELEKELKALKAPKAKQAPAKPAAKAKAKR
jgi:hypothetical protein